MQVCQAYMSNDNAIGSYIVDTTNDNVIYCLIELSWMRSFPFYDIKVDLHKFGVKRQIHIGMTMATIGNLLKRRLMNNIMLYRCSRS